MRARSARRLSVLPARTQLSSVERSSGVNVRAVGYLLMPHHDIDRCSLQLSTNHAGASVQLAWILQNDGRPEDALQVLQSAKSRCPRSPELWAAEARIMLAERRRNNACALIEEGLKFMPENVAWRAIAIDLYIQCGQHEGAIDAARR